MVPLQCRPSAELMQHVKFPRERAHIRASVSTDLLESFFFTSTIVHRKQWFEKFVCSSVQLCWFTPYRQCWYYYIIRLFPYDLFLTQLFALHEVRSLYAWQVFFFEWVNGRWSSEFCWVMPRDFIECAKKGAKRWKANRQKIRTNLIIAWDDGNHSDCQK